MFAFYAQLNFSKVPKVPKHLHNIITRLSDEAVEQWIAYGGGRGMHLIIW